MDHGEEMLHVGFPCLADGLGAIVRDDKAQIMVGKVIGELFALDSGEIEDSKSIRFSGRNTAFTSRKGMMVFRDRYSEPARYTRAH